MKDDPEHRELAEIIIKLAEKIAKLEKKIIDITLWHKEWGGNMPDDINDELREILER